MRLVSHLIGLQFSWINLSLRTTSRSSSSVPWPSPKTSFCTPSRTAAGTLISSRSASSLICLLAIRSRWDRFMSLNLGTSLFTMVQISSPNTTRTSQLRPISCGSQGVMERSSSRGEWVHLRSRRTYHRPSSRPFWPSRKNHRCDREPARGRKQGG